MEIYKVRLVRYAIRHIHMQGSNLNPRMFEGQIRNKNPDVLLFFGIFLLM